MQKTASRLLMPAGVSMDQFRLLHSDFKAQLTQLEQKLGHKPEVNEWPAELWRIRNCLDDMRPYLKDPSGETKRMRSPPPLSTTARLDFRMSSDRQPTAPKDPAGSAVPSGSGTPMHLTPHSQPRGPRLARLLRRPPTRSRAPQLAAATPHPAAMI